MLFTDTYQGFGTADAFRLTSAVEHEFQHLGESEEMAKRISRSLQDDAFDAEESVLRRNRVMGIDLDEDELELEISDDAEDFASEDQDESETHRREPTSDPTEDPVRMYLMQMGVVRGSW